MAPRRFVLAMVASLLACAAPPARAQAPACGVEDLAWLAGEWSGRSGNVAMTEVWLEPEGGVLLGLHRDVFGPDRSFFEYLRIAPDGTGTPVYHASPRGREATPFRLVECGPGHAAFENPTHDYPQRIVYARKGDALTARIEGVEDGEAKSSEWRWENGRAADRRALLELQAVERRAHLEKDADLLVSLFADDFANVAAGRVTTPSRQEQRERFAAYLGSVEFLEWDDVEPPVIRISEDGTLAWVRVTKRVRLVPADAPGAEPEHTVYAWLETWEKHDGEWRLTSVTSTERPGGE